MAPLLKLRQAARLIGVSPGRLYRAIADGRLTAAPGGGPGKSTLVSLEALQAFCRSEGLRIPDEADMMERLERSERRERSMTMVQHPVDGTFQDVLTQRIQQTLDAMAGQYLARIMERQSEYFEAFLRDELSHLVNRVLERVVDQVVERLTDRLTAESRTGRERPERSERSEHSLLAMPEPKAAVLQRLRAMQAEGLSLHAIANRLNAEGVPTLSGKGTWKKGTISNLLKE